MVHKNVQQMKKELDYFGNEICVGDDVLHITTYKYRKGPKIQRGKVIDVDPNRLLYTVRVHCEGNIKSGWTYSTRIINLKFVNIP